MKLFVWVDSWNLGSAGDQVMKYFAFFVCVFWWQPSIKVEYVSMQITSVRTRSAESFFEILFLLGSNNLQIKRDTRSNMSVTVTFKEWWLLMEEIQYRNICHLWKFWLTPFPNSALKNSYSAFRSKHIEKQSTRYWSTKKRHICISNIAQKYDFRRFIVLDRCRLWYNLLL